MFATAVRAETLVVAAAVKVTVALPTPLPELGVSHGWLLEAVQFTVLGVAVTFTVVESPDSLAGSQVPLLRVMVPAACVTATVWPPIVTVAVRGARLVVEAAVRTTGPPPVPLGALNVSHDSSLAAVQFTVDGVVVTVTLVTSPAAATEFQVLVLRVRTPPAWVTAKA